MALIRVVAERSIEAPPERIYAVLRDYREHHPKILPPAFSNYRVEEGGVGAGTIAAFTVTVGGRPRIFRVRVEEPEPGRVLRESDQESDLVATFTVVLEGSGSRIQFETTWQSAGVTGLIERLFAPRMLRGVYLDELERLDRYVRQLDAPSQ